MSKGLIGLMVALVGMITSAHGGVTATGGTITINSGYIIHTFTNVGTTNFVVSGGSLTCDVLVVAGGGSANYNGHSAGGGAGGVVYSNSITISGTNMITVGAGGPINLNPAQPGKNGSNSVFGTLTAIGGGAGGGNLSRNGVIGGSGGGSYGYVYDNNTPGSGTSGQGNNGGRGYSDNSTYTASGGGGGAGAIGGNGSTTSGGNGGAGVTNSISGAAVVYAGGGGGACERVGYPGGTGGIGGGGNGGATGIKGGDGSPNTGGGGGGGGGSTNTPGSGGSGIVIVRYPITNAPSAPPANLSASDDTYTDKVRITWNTVSEATSYQIFRHTSNNSTSADQIGTSTSTSYDDTGAVAGTIYYYWVKAVNSVGASGFSSSDTGRRATIVVVPSAPTGVSASDGTYTDKVQITWSAASGATNYEVWRYTGDNSGLASKISNPDPTGTNYDDTDVTADTNYYYWVKAVNAAGVSSFSALDNGFVGVVGPLITANGLVGNVYLNSGDAVTIAVQMMNIEPFLFGYEVDWWVVALEHTVAGEWYYLNSNMQWPPFSGDSAFCRPVYQGPLFNLSAKPVLNGSILPRGTYDFWFAVEYPMNGILNPSGQILVDKVTIIVQ